MSSVIGGASHQGDALGGEQRKALGNQIGEHDEEQRHGEKGNRGGDRAGVFRWEHEGGKRFERGRDRGFAHRPGEDGDAIQTDLYHRKVVTRLVLQVQDPFRRGIALLGQHLDAQPARGGERDLRQREERARQYEQQQDEEDRHDENFSFVTYSL